MTDQKPEDTLTWAVDWRPDTRAYLQRLAGHLDQRDDSGQTSSVSVPLGRIRLLVTLEEIELITALHSQGEPEERIHQLILDGVGLKVKLLASVKTAVKAKLAAVAAMTGGIKTELEPETGAEDENGAEAEIGQNPEPEPDVETEVETDGEADSENETEELPGDREDLTKASAVEVAMSTLKDDIGHIDELSTDLQSLVSAQSKLGDIEGAQAIAEHRRRLLGVLDEVERFHPGLTTEGEGPESNQKTAFKQDHDPKATARARAKHLAKSKKKKKRAIKAPKHSVAIAVTGITLGIAVGFGSLFLRYYQPDLAHFSTSDIKNLPGVTDVIHRSPELLVIVSNESWDAMKSDHKQAAMQSLADLARKAGYRRAEIRTQTRQNLGVWRRGEELKIR